MRPIKILVSMLLISLLAYHQKIIYRHLQSYQVPKGVGLRNNLAGKTPILNTEEARDNETSENRSFRFNESPMMHKWLDGLKGLEIGASSHNGFGLDTLNVDYTTDETKYSVEQIKLAKVYRRVDVVVLGNNLPYDDDAVGFVLSSHAIEHFYDPIGAVCEWLRVVKVGGFVATIAPHKMRMFDKDEERTTLDELLGRRENPIDPEEDEHDHWSFWITEDFLEMCEYMGWKVVEYQDTDDKVGNGFAVVVEKTGTSLSKC